MSTTTTPNEVAEVHTVELVTAGRTRASCAARSG